MGNKLNSSGVMNFINFSIRRFLPLQKGFTLIEVLIVVAVIAILGAIAVMTLNPAQAAKRARDAQRRKDVSTYQAILEQYLEDNRSTFTTGMTATTITAGATNACAGGVLKQSNWTMDTCAYASTQPLDAVNKTAQTITNGAGGTLSDDLAYEIQVNTAGNYRICSHFESTGNAGALTADGGTYTNVYEVFNSSSSPGCNAVN